MKICPCLLLLSFPLLTLRAEWPTYQHDNSRVGHTEESLKAPLTARWQFSSPTPPQLAWSGEDGRVVEGLELRNRVRFDDCFQVAMAEGRVYFGSTVDGRVNCHDLKTGKEIWSFFTDGPVRLAPTLVKGLLYIGSDDGYAYCLKADTGTLVWKLRAGPNDERILARGRMISRWPVRTGLLVDSGIAYFGAGVFPHENIYLYAVDATTGKVQWVNDAISQEDAGRNDLSPQGYLLATKELLFVPSGRALSVAFDRKTGKQVNKPTPGWRGDAGGQIGGSQAMLVEDQILAVGEHQILALDQKTGKTGYAWFQGRQITMTGETGFMATGKHILAIDRENHANGSRERHAIQAEITALTNELRRHPAIAELKNVEKAQAALKTAEKAAAKTKTPATPTAEKPTVKTTTVSAPATQAAADGKTVPTTTPAAPLSDLEKKQKALTGIAAKYEKLRLDYDTKKDRLAEQKIALEEMKDIGIKWQYRTKHESALIHAGGTLIVGGQGEVICLNAKTGKPFWQTKVEGEARGLAVSGGHLIVSTTTGHIYAFADTTQAHLPAIAPTVKPTPDPFPHDAHSALYVQAAETILKSTGIKQGFCLVLGSDQGRLAYEIAKRSDLTIFGVEADAAKVNASRKRLLSTGLYGSRITIDHLDLDLIPYSSYFANLIVSDSLLLTGKLPGIPTEVARTLKPLGGKICLLVNDPQTTPGTDLTAWLQKTKLSEEKATITNTGTLTTLTRAALPGADSWSHQYGNAGNTSSNNDQRVKGGLNILWYGDPGPGASVNRHDGAVGPLSVNGRLFTQGELSIQAHDAYNGQFLWEVKNPGAMRIGVFNSREPGNMAASDDYLFMLLDDKCLQFDAATGKTVREFKIPGETKPNLQWGYLAYHEGLLYGTVTQRVANAAEAARRGKSASIATDLIFAYDVKTGALKWTHQGKHISHVSIAIGDGRIFFIDASLTPAQREDMLRQDKTELAKLTGKAREIAEDRVKKADLRRAVALDAKTGTQQWAQSVDVTDCSEIGIGGGALTMMYHNNHLILGGANANGHYWEQFLAGEFARRRIVVLDAVKGEKLWAKDANYRSRPIVINNDIIAEPWAYDIYTGEQKMRTHPLTGEKTPWMFARPGHHCGALSATSNLMFFRSKSTAYYNMDEDKGTEHFAGQRLGCWINTIPANGLVMIPEASAGCVCLFSIASTLVFEPRADRMSWGVYSATGASKPVQHMALNLGAPGDRRDAQGKLWLSYPRPSSRPGIDLPLNLQHKLAKGGAFYDHNEESYPITGTQTPWIFTSGVEGLLSAELPLQAKDQKAQTYTVRLYFAAPEGDKAGTRSFSIKLQGQIVREKLDIAAKAKGSKHALVEEFTQIPVTENLRIDLSPTNPKNPHLPVLSGIEVLRTNATEIKDGVVGR